MLAPTGGSSSCFPPNMSLLPSLILESACCLILSCCFWTECLVHSLSIPLMWLPAVFHRCRIACCGMHPLGSMVTPSPSTVHRCPVGTMMPPVPRSDTCPLVFCMAIHLLRPTSLVLCLLTCRGLMTLVSAPLCTVAH